MFRGTKVKYATQNNSTILYIGSVRESFIWLNFGRQQFCFPSPWRPRWVLSTELSLIRLQPRRAQSAKQVGSKLPVSKQYCLFDFRMISLLKRFRLDFHDVIVMTDSERTPQPKK